MEQHWSTVCALLLALSAFVHYGVAFAAQKSGVCPVPATGFGVGLCHHFCFNDMDCPETEKCCHNGCGYECRAPYKEKPGRCPPINGPTTCDEACAQDWQCPGTQKCCKTCGHGCYERQ